MDQDIATFQPRLDDENYISLVSANKSLYVDKVSEGSVERLFTAVSKDDLDKRLIQGSNYTALQTQNELYRLQISDIGVPAVYRFDASAQKWVESLLVQKSDFTDKTVINGRGIVTSNSDQPIALYIDESKKTISIYVNGSSIGKISYQSL